MVQWGSDSRRGSLAYLVIYQAQDQDPTLFWRVSAAGSSVLFSLVMLAAAMAWLSARRAGCLRRSTLGWLAAALVFVDLATVGAYTDLGKKPPTAGYEHPQAIEFLKSEAGVYRIDSRTDVGNVWQPNLALLAGLYDVSGVDNPLVVADVARYYAGVGSRSTPLYDFLGVRYVIGSKEVELDWTKFELALDSDPTVNVYRNTMALPRAFVVHRTRVAAGHEDAWQRIHQSGFDPADTIVLEGGQSLDLQPQGKALVEIVRYEPNALEIEIDSPSEGYLVLSDPFYPGWHADVDGQPTEILRANYAFRAVAVPAGAHRVSMAFRPTSWLAGLVFSVLTVLVLLVLVWLAWLRRRGSPSRPASEGRRTQNAR